MITRRAWDKDRFMRPSRVHNGMCEHGFCDWCPQGCFDQFEQLTKQVPADIPLDQAVEMIHRIAERDRKALEAAGALPDEDVTHERD